MGELIPAERLDAARRARRDRASGRDLLVLAACCCWPLTLTVFFGIAAFETTLDRWGRR